MSVAESLAAVLPPACFEPLDGDGTALGPDASGNGASRGPGSVTRPEIRGREPEAIVRPGTTEEVSAVLSWASKEGVGVLPVSSGRRARAVEREGRYVVLATDRLSDLEIYEPADLTLTAGAGTPFAMIDAALRTHRQWAPFDPPFVNDRSLGGLVASGDSGPLWMGYGELRNHVLGATLVTGDGRVLRLGGRVVKNVAGYDVLKLVVGSRGSLGVITSVCIRAFPLPLIDRVLVLRARSVSDLVGYARKVATAPVMPVSSVLVDRVGRLGAAPATGSAVVSSDGASVTTDASAAVMDEAALVVRIHGAAETVDADQATLEAHVGVAFESTDGRGGLALEAMRDRGADASVVVVASALPSRLEDLVAALSLLGPVGLVVDSYGARARVALGSYDAASIARARDAIEAIGGALRVARAPTGGDTEAVGSRPTEDEAGLADLLRATFDPAGALWPTRS